MVYRYILKQFVFPVSLKIWTTYNSCTRQFQKWRKLTIVITHTGCIAAGVGIAFSRVCLFVHAIKGQRLELLTPNFVDGVKIG